MLFDFASMLQRPIFQFRSSLMVPRTRGSIWRKATAWKICNKTKIIEDLRWRSVPYVGVFFQRRSVPQGSWFRCTAMEWCKVDLRHLRSGAQDKLIVVHGVWVLNIIKYNIINMLIHILIHLYIYIYNILICIYLYYIVVQIQCGIVLSCHFCLM